LIAVVVELVLFEQTSTTAGTVTTSENTLLTLFGSKLGGEGAWFRLIADRVRETWSIEGASTTAGSLRAKATRASSEDVLASCGTVRTVLSDAVHVGVRVGNELQDSVAHVCTFASQHLDLLVVSQDPRMVQHLVNLHPLVGVLDQKLRDEVFTGLRHVLPDWVLE